ncbi:hypothetical protein MIND_00434300 [Mycena indigotica]|uniref:DUF6699 domain-containing protein n=1 Tax=Mycena indigotica TaxID=2126181 RepID=A0A8H6SXF2_9AGAR|nr:uncharacterized protein MIND_00434300 [Mycena indigotica]KAF7306431.1 hypothetical protein MIND_00434300 [Mycena indigotica]
MSRQVHFSNNVYYTSAQSPSPSVASFASYCPPSPVPTACLDPLLTPQLCAALTFHITDSPCPAKPSALRAPATTPSVAKLEVTHPGLAYFGWKILVTAADGHCVRIDEVLKGIYTSLRQGVDSETFHSLRSHQAANVTKAFQTRSRNRDGEANKGLKRVDLVTSVPIDTTGNNYRTRFAGLVPVLSKSQPSVPLYELKLI